MKVTFSTNHPNNNIAQSNRTQNPSFKEIIPVVHWVPYRNGNFMPTAKVSLSQRLQSQIVRILNKARKQLPKTEEEKQLVDVMKGQEEIFGERKTDYSKDMVVRSFYNRARELGDKIPDFRKIVREHRFVSYIISGQKHIKKFEEAAQSHEIGKEKSIAIEMFEMPYSLEAESAIDEYNEKGLYFVGRQDLRMRDKNGNTLVLHTKFEPIRKKNGEIARDTQGRIKYKFIGAKLLPEFGLDSPIEKLKQRMAE